MGQPIHWDLLDTAQHSVSNVTFDVIGNPEVNNIDFLFQGYRMPLNF